MKVCPGFRICQAIKNMDSNTLQGFPFLRRQALEKRSSCSWHVPSCLTFSFKRESLSILNSSISDQDFFTGSPGDFFKIRSSTRNSEEHLRFWDSEFFFCKLINFNWRLITLKYCSGFCNTFRWISHGCTCVPHPKPPSHLPSHPIPQGHPGNISPEHPVSCIEPGLVIYFTYGNIHVSMLFSQIIPTSPSPTESKSLLYNYVSFAVLHIGSSLPSF